MLKPLLPHPASTTHTSIPTLQASHLSSGVGAGTGTGVGVAAAGSASSSYTTKGQMLIHKPYPNKILQDSEHSEILKNDTVSGYYTAKSDKPDNVAMVTVDLNPVPVLALVPDPVLVPEMRRKVSVDSLRMGQRLDLQSPWPHHQVCHSLPCNIR